MRHERERPPQPVWQKALNEFQQARDRYVENPTSGNMIFTRVFHERLLEQLKQPGKFELGQMLKSRGAEYAIGRAKQFPAEFLIRHANGDFGDLDDEDKQANENALIAGTRIFSVYHTKNDEKLYLITEWDRSVTTLLRSDEY